jgi:NAD(P)-dependent dehydrogenase (short-subunit alcohol dehydrogenase family)
VNLWQKEKYGNAPTGRSNCCGRLTGDRAGLVEAFLKRGYNVVANSRNITKTNPFPASANLALVDRDIGDPKTAAKIVDTAVSRFGRVDVLINNAGFFIPKPSPSTRPKVSTPWFPRRLRAFSRFPSYR